MKRFRKSLLVGLVIFGMLAVFLPKVGFAAEESALPTPTVYAPVQDFSTVDASLLITGVTFNNTTVAVYIDDAFNGYAAVKNDESGVASWAYQPYLPLKPGAHTVFTRAEEPNSDRRSSLSESIDFNVLLPYPAPTLDQPVVNSETNYQKPWVVGLSKNDSKVRIYLDGKYDGELNVVNDPSGIASFRYMPSEGLSIGDHEVYAIAVDDNGKESKSSSTMALEISIPQVTNVVPTTQASQTSSNKVSIEATDGTEERIEEEITELKVIEESSEESDEPEEVTGESSAEEDSSPTKQAVGWGILGVLLVGIVYQRRGTIARVFKKKKDDSNSSSDSNVQVITKDKSEDSTDKPKTGWEPKDKDNDKNDPNDAPSPPPPASHY